MRAVSIHRPCGAHVQVCSFGLHGLSTDGAPAPRQIGHRRVKGLTDHCKLQLMRRPRPITTPLSDIRCKPVIQNLHFTVVERDQIRSHARTFPSSSVRPVGFAPGHQAREQGGIWHAEPALARGSWLVALGALGVAGLLLNGPAWAQQTTTQTTSLSNGETVDTGTTVGTSDPVAGHGLYARGTTVDAPGNNTITTGGGNAHGIFLNGSAFGVGPVPVAPSSSTAAGTAITTTGQGAYGIFAVADAGGTATVMLDGVTIETHGNNAHGVSIASIATGVASAIITGGSITADGGGATAVLQAIGANTTVSVTDSVLVHHGSGSDRPAVSATQGSTVNLFGATHVSTTQANMVAVGANSGSTVTIADTAIIDTAGDGADGLQELFSSTMTVGAATVTSHGARQGLAHVRRRHRHPHRHHPHHHGRTTARMRS